MSAQPDEAMLALAQAHVENEQRRLAVENALLDAIQRAAEDSAGSDDAREVGEYLRGALSAAQAIVILDPALVAPQGVPPDALHPPVPHIQEQQGPGQGPGQQGQPGKQGQDGAQKP